MSTVFLEGVNDGSGGRVWGRPRLSWMHSVSVAFGSRVMAAARQCA